MLKRTFDIVCAAAGFAVLSPLFVFVSILVKLDSIGPVFFKQKRVGQHFREFDLIKFRSMVVGAPQKGLAITAGNDHRVTRVGRILRKMKIDELPQLINVLKGDMSLVGPRPEVPKYVGLFRKDYEEILTVRPGITDYASIRYRDEESVLASYADPEIAYIKEVLPAKIKLARQYIREQSAWTDLKIILQTLYAIVS